MRIDLLIILSSLVACAASGDASVTPTTPTAPAASASCDGGDIVFQIDRKTVAGRADRRASSIVVRSSGAWTFDVLRDGKLARQQRGCMAKADVAALAAAVDGAPWKTTTPDVLCEIGIVEYTEYLVRGRPVWQAKGCASDLLDAASKSALATALGLVRPLVTTDTL